MNWTQILANVVGVAGACLTAHGLAGAGFGVVTDRGAWLGVALCVGSNLAGLFKTIPTAAPPAPRIRP